MGSSTLLRISRSCGLYEPHNASSKWLKSHAGHEIYIIGSDCDTGQMKSYKVISLLDGTRGNAWQREIDNFKEFNNE